MSEVLTTEDVGRLADEIPDARVRALARSHERLREMFAEACVRVGKQSDLLSTRAEKKDPKS